MGSYDRRLCWFDMDLSTSPYKTMRAHKYAVRSVAYHPRLPLFASASDDATIHVYHGRVYGRPRQPPFPRRAIPASRLPRSRVHLAADLLMNPLIVPLKILKVHKHHDHLGVMSIVFHPTQPWLFSAGSDGEVHLLTEL
jgi:ribosome biogenesis protein ERB1